MKNVVKLFNLGCYLTCNSIVTFLSPDVNRATSIFCNFFVIFQNVHIWGCAVQIRGWKWYGAARRGHSPVNSLYSRLGASPQPVFPLATAMSSQ